MIAWRAAILRKRFTARYKAVNIASYSEPAMTDYSIWIYAMLAFGGLITAAVLFTLSKPSDLPYLQEKG